MNLRRFQLPSAALAALLLVSCTRSPTPVIADVDSDDDDMVSLAYLCQEHQRGNCGSPR